MEPETTIPEPPVVAKSALRDVTPFSKYLAMGLFITMPFVGGWIGYNYAHVGSLSTSYDSVVTKGGHSVETGTQAVETTPSPASSTAAVLSTEPVTDSQSTQVPTAAIVDYPVLPGTYFSRVSDVERQFAPINERRLNDELVLVGYVPLNENGDVMGSHASSYYVLLNKLTKAPIREVFYPVLVLEEWVTPTIRVTAEPTTDGFWQVVVRNYASGTEAVVYKELESDVQLADVWELGMAGILHVTSDGKVVFARHRARSGTTATDLVDVKVVPLPKQFWENNLSEYWEGGV